MRTIIAVYGVSRWTNASRASTVHLPNNQNTPLCNDKRKVFSWMPIYDEDVKNNVMSGVVTCQKCLRLNKK